MCKAKWQAIVEGFVSSVGENVDKGDWKESAFGGVPLEDALHPVLVFGDLVEDDDGLTLFERQLVLVVGLAVVEGATSPKLSGVGALKCEEGCSLLTRDRRAEKATKCKRDQFFKLSLLELNWFVLSF
jgi:hypothetical protein